jgi:choline kinase
MITAQTVGEMSLKRVALIKSRDLLFDEYLDTLDKYTIWKANVKDMIVCHGKANKSGEQMLKILKDHLRSTSRKLRVLDAEITGIKRLPDNFHTILEIN